MDVSGPSLPRGGTNVTVNFMMTFTTLGPKVRVGDIMDTTLEPSCFRYE